jgi:hypothetical protein
MRKGITVFDLLGISLVLFLVIVIAWPIIRPNICQGAPKTACMDNQRQLALGLLMYVQDSDETFPDAQRWNELLVKRYRMTGKVWDCATSPFKGTEKQPDFFFFAGPGTFLSGVALGDIKKPATTPMLADLKDGAHKLPYVDKGKEDVAQIISRVDCRHQKGTTMTYIDGHIAWVPVKIVNDTKTYQGCIVKR